MAALMPAIVPGAAGAALEARSGPASALVGASAPAAIVASAIPSAATAEGTLEAGAGVSADARGIAREIFAGR